MILNLAKTVWGFLWAMSERMHRTHLGLISAGVAFYAMFAVFPGLAAIISLWGLVADPSVIFTYVNVTDQFIPDAANALIYEQIVALVNHGRTRLGWASLVSILIATLAARAGVDALVRGLNAIHNTRAQTGIWRYLLGYILTLTLVGVVLVGLLTVVVVPLIFNFVELGRAEGWLLTALPWAGIFIIVLVTIGILYRYSPNVDGQRPPFLSAGALLAALLWAAASVGFSIYLGSFNSYDRIYGSIGAVIALLTWFYLGAYSVLLGALFNVELRRHRAIAARRQQMRTGQPADQDTQQELVETALPPDPDRPGSGGL
ncbi:YihY/virulence factor BrkB family protein [Paracoccus sp. p4-l81]|uniref:YihY/virulence factor BrkB family protein n=1 Tax=unclassified Paracoccus (in: a-proteobacteria) TaxID=2688777 RepID=UPI0035B8D1F5